MLLPELVVKRKAMFVQFSCLTSPDDAVPPAADTAWAGYSLMHMHVLSQTSLFWPPCKW